MWKEEGNFHCQIVKAQLIEGRFKDKPNQLDIELVLTDGKDTGSWYGSLSSDWIKTGNNTGKQEFQVTMERVNEIHPIGAQIARLPELVGKEVDIFVKKSDKGYFNIYLGGHSGKVIDPAAAQARLASLFGGQPQQQAGGFQQPQGNGFVGNGQPSGFAGNGFQQNNGGFQQNNGFAGNGQGGFVGNGQPNNGNPFAR